MGTGRRIEKVSPIKTLLNCRHCALLAAIAAVLVQMCAAFNLDVENRSVYTGPKGSFFGYSVEFYQSSSSVSILIGAPKANTSQPHVTEGGSVFLCPWIRGQHDCNIINFDSKGERRFHVNNTDLPVEFKSHQWFGATVRSHGNTVLACAPRYYWRTEHDVPFSDATGTCYLSVDDFRMFVEYAPCRTERHGPAGQGYCQGGFSADFTKDGKVVLGGPGSFYWQGQLISATTEEIIKAYYPSYFLLSVAGQIQTSQAQGSYDDSYLGYSVAGGEFSGDSVEDFITGIPKGLMLYGLVSILDGKDLRSILNLTGEQMGSYFGYAVAATDIDNDGLMDLVVGAPMFMQSLYGRVEEVGKVYVYLQRGSLVPGHPPSLQGTQAFGRFGSSLAPLGDLDQDGFNDIAVGCPFGGEDHQGLVFIFNGHSSGLEATTSQTISGQWASSTFPASFGFALRGNKDLDQNGYPDLIVGAFGVDKAVIYRGRPIVRASASLLVHPSMINPEERSCEVTKGNQTISVACASLSFCISAQGKHLPADLGFVVEVQLDHLKLTQTGSEYRTLFLDSQLPSLLSNITLGNGGRICRNTRIYLRGEDEFRDKLSPVDVTLRFSLDPEAPEDVHGLTPILHHHTAQFIQQKGSRVTGANPSYFRAVGRVHPGLGPASRRVEIQLDCGEDNICVPDLKLDVYSDRSEVFLEDENLLTLTFNGRNEGEGGAYEAELYVTLPWEVDYSGIARSNASLAHLICRYDGVNNTRYLVCHLGNPMKSATSLWAGLRFTVPRLKDTHDRIHFEMQIRSKNENNSRSEVVFVDLEVAVVADVIVQGVSHPDQLLFPSLTWKGRDSLLEEKDVGPEIQHVYELVNNGPSMINHSVLELWCPFRAQGHDLLYPVEVFTQGPLNCTSERTLNMLKLKLQPPTTDQPPSSPSEHHIQRREVHRDLLFEHSNLSCSTVECWKLGCDVGLLRRGEGVIVTVRSRLWAETFIQRAPKSSVLECSIQYNVLTMPYSIIPRQPLSGSRKVVTPVVWNKPHSQDSVPLWIIVLAVLAGMLLLSLLIYILYRLGFFKRSDPYGTAMEKAQLKPQASSEA